MKNEENTKQLSQIETIYSKKIIGGIGGNGIGDSWRCQGICDSWRATSGGGKDTVYNRFFKK